jgi:hypothetical protein
MPIKGTTNFLTKQTFLQKNISFKIFYKILCWQTFLHYLCSAIKNNRLFMLMPVLQTNYKVPANLFGTQNAKTLKGEKLGYTTYILYMSPHKQNSRGKNLCPKATEGCKAACLFTAGRGKFSNVHAARVNKTEYFLSDRDGFMAQAAKEIALGVKKLGADKICIRFNGTSDVPFENIPVGGFPNIMSMFPDVQFYDYTKVFTRLQKELPANYHLTFSRAETKMNQAEAELALQLGYNVAAVFNVKDGIDLPATYKGFKVINGDEHDLTFKHEKNVIVGLKSKGDAKNDATGFVIRDF